MAKAKDISGQTFGRLTVIRRSGSDERRHALWHCVCECGKEKIVSSQSLLSGKTNSCGCLHKESARGLLLTHGKSNTKLYNVWRGMKKRCYCQENENFKYYGGRGITICEEWRDNFEAFYTWAISNGYADNLSIDRIDVNGNYEPSNCRWATVAEQNRNKRKTYTKRETA